MAGDENKPKLPLKLRLKAWWEGYDSDEMAARLHGGLSGGGAADTAPSKGKKKASNSAAPETESEVPIDPWDQETIDIAQYIWGDGFCGPGGPEYIVTLSKLLALSPEMSMIEIGCGLGGRSRTLVDRFGVWITGYEESDGLVKAGKEMSKMAGVTKKANITKFQLDGFEGFDRKFDRALAKESLFTVQDKKMIIEKTEESLKAGGLVLVTDYVVDNESVLSSDNYKAWKVSERSTPYCITPDDYSEMFKEARMQVRVSEDISAEYVSMINKAWAGAEKVAAKLAKEEGGPRLIQILMREAEFWTRRKKMLESGDLKLWRMVANKKTDGPSMMSDW